MQGKIAGYTIFDWNYQEDGMNDFDITRTYFQYTDNVSDNLFFKVRFDVARAEKAADQKLRVFLKNSYVDLNRQIDLAKHIKNQQSHYKYNNHLHTENN